jgi:uncharacterized protein YecE (DUF72 family)
MQVLAGTSGFSYAAWKGPFYPKDLPVERMLSFYAGRLPTVELNNTFYRMPSGKLLAGWRAQVPASFRFALKAPQRITHVLRLANVGEVVATLYRVAAELGPTLGPVLYQLPPSLKADPPLLQAFLQLLPPGGRAAFEFRHRTWFADPVYDLLRSHNAALCIAESEDLEAPVISTADWGYLRLRRQDYAGSEILAWAERILSQPWGEACVYFKHEEAGAGPRFAEALAAVVQARL